MPNPEYIELETEDEVRNAYLAQETVEEKFFYTLNHSVRNTLIMNSLAFISEKERMNLGMPAGHADSFGRKDTSEFQNSMNKQLKGSFYWSVYDEFFSKDGEKADITVDGCVDFFEFMGSLPVMPYVDVGKRYREVSKLVPKDGNSPEDVHFKTKFLLKNGLAMESNVLTEMDYMLENVQEVVVVDNPFYTVANQRLGINLQSFFNKMFREHNNDSMENFMDAIKITDPEERAAVLNAMGCKGEDSVENVRAICKTRHVKFTEEMTSAVTTAWKNQGCKKKLASLSEKELQAYKIGKEADNLEIDKKYKAWVAEEGDELMHELQYNTLKKAFQKCNEKIKSTEPLGYSFPKNGKMLSFSELDKISTKDIMEERFSIKTKADTEQKKAKESKTQVENKYRTYLSKHTGLNKISDIPEKNYIMLSKAMAASMLANSKYVMEYKVDTIHEVADKIRETMKLSQMPLQNVLEALESPESIEKLTQSEIKKLYTPSTPADLILDMRQLKRDMMSGMDRSIEYRNFVKAVQSIAVMNSDKRDDPKMVEDSREKGLELLKAVEVYTKGKKSIRSSEDGNERFNNALDALAILKKHIPGLQEPIDLLVNRINTVRKATDPNAEGHVDLEKYGRQRALEARKARINKAHGIKPEKQAVMK